MNTTSIPTATCITVVDICDTVYVQSAELWRYRIAVAYLFGLLSTDGPRALKIVLLLCKRRLTVQAACHQIPLRTLFIQLLRLFPSHNDLTSLRIASLLAKFFASLTSASLSFALLNTRPSSYNDEGRDTASHLRFIKPGPFDEPPESLLKDVDDNTLNAKSLSRAELAGKTIDLTLFAVCRAADVLIQDAKSRIPLKPSSKARVLSRAVTPMLFCFSAATIMHAWFYSPSRLPHSYNTWISSAAKLDHRLLLVLRHAKYGTWRYGEDTGMGQLLGSMCHDYGLPEELGDPSKTVPVPCELVHMGCGKSCEKHALIRFWRGWSFAARIHAPLQLLVLLRHVRANARPGNKFAGLTKLAIIRAISNIARNSSFLGVFIALFYYGVCLSRTRLGPKLFSYKTVTPQMWDSGLCVLGGCLLCSLSILVEQPRKRLEILLFVLPRATATWFPRRYLPEHRWKEHLAFALSAAVVMTAAQENPKRVRGVFGSLLRHVLKTN
ncbi:unnamed protein product [Periconia digitata]|uniref:Integral membrane protein n=1 Tax=Periconia digitata TaxID=1303443 RepID=A0A9W4U3B0_9PLEO|nr:unnamed protein product [Periconia digitata]